MAVSNFRTSYPKKRDEVWAVVTDLKNYRWRSDLSRIEVVEPGRVFVEYTKGGFPTTFTITCFRPFDKYSFTMENDNLTGTWTGLFSETPEGTSIDFTEEVAPKRALMKPFVKGFLKKQQKRYAEDLRKALEG